MNVLYAVAVTGVRLLAVATMAGIDCNWPTGTGGTGTGTGGTECACQVRVHATECTNAIDGTPSWASETFCADGCAATCDQAEANAKAALETQTCLGDAWGCCQTVTDSDTSWCGGGA